MKILIAVFADLWNYFFGRFHRVKGPQSDKTRFDGKELTIISNEVTVVTVTKEESTNLTQPLEKKLDNNFTVRNVLAGEEAFVRVPKSLLYQKPIQAFDTVISTLDYGQKVVIFGQLDDFVKVKVFDYSGYLNKADITSLASEVFPAFTTEQVYFSDSKTTKRVRLLLNDAFMSSHLNLPLRPEEFVQYKLEKDNRFIPWGKDRPRLAGSWHELLKGKVGVRIGIEPKTGSIFEYARKNTLGVLGYVESVHADYSITLESVVRVKEGQYLKENIPKSEWQKHRPVFIQVT